LVPRRRWQGRYATGEDSSYIVVVVWRISDQVRSSTGEDGAFVVVVVWRGWYLEGGGEVDLIRERMGLISW